MSSNDDNKKEMLDWNELVERITCPITRQIFYKPVLATDGHTYEETAFFNWHKEHNTSPITREKITDDVKPNYAIKSIIDMMINLNPEFKKKIFKPDLTYKTNKKKIEQIIKDKEYHKLMEYVEFQLEELNMKDILTDCKDAKMIGYLLENCTNIHYTIDGWNLANHASRNNNIHALRIAISKNVDTNVMVKDWNNLQLACYESSFEVIDILIDLFNVSDKMIGKIGYLHLISNNKTITDDEKDKLRLKLIKRIQDVAVDQYKKSVLKE